jgi:hypothetical protein
MRQSLKLFLAFLFFLISCKNNNENEPIDDCNGDLGGISFLNICDVCVGGDTEIPVINQYINKNPHKMQGFLF